MAANTATSGSVAGGNGNGTQQKGVEERLRILLSLLESSKEDAKNGREDTLQYLSQLESVARRLKDQLLNDNISNDSKVSFISVSYFLENPGNACNDLTRFFFKRSIAQW